MHASSVRLVSSLSADEVRSRLAEIRLERSRLDAEEASLVGRLSELSVERSSTVVPEFEMTQYAGLRGRESSRVVQRSGMLDVLPEFGSALASGSIVAGHVDVLADSLKKVSESDRETVLGQADSLLRSARRLSVDQFAKHLRSEVSRLSCDKGLGVFERQRPATYLKFWNDVDGMVHLRGAFDPERGSVLLSRLEQRVEATSLALPRLLPRVRGVAGGRCALASRQHGAGVQIEHRVRVGRHAIVSSRDTRPPADRCRRDGGVRLGDNCRRPTTSGLVDGSGRMLSTSRSSPRLASTRTRVMLRDRRVKRHVKRSPCEPHHIEYWERGGATDIANLVPLCSRHRHAAHECGWKLKLGPNTRQLSIDRGPPN